jgi:hypothetical protein
MFTNWHYTPGLSSITTSSFYHLKEIIYYMMRLSLSLGCDILRESLLLKK